jgi:hypothetical protein
MAAGEALAKHGGKDEGATTKVDAALEPPRYGDLVGFTHRD